MLVMPASAEPATGHAVQPSQSTADTPADDAAAEIDIDPPPDADTAAETEGQSDPDAEAAETVESDQEESAAELAKDPTVIVTIDKGVQQMTVWVDGIEKYTWPVSTGIGGYSTPSGTYTPGSMNKIWYSKQWDNAPMPHAIFFTKKGHAIHGTTDEKHLGKPASHGCVRLSRKNAETLFNLVADRGLENTEVVLTGVTPGGEYKVAQPPRQKNVYPQYPGYPGYYGRYGYYDEAPPVIRRNGRRKRLFQPYYQAPPQQPQYQQRRGWFRPPGY